MTNTTTFYIGNTIKLVYVGDLQRQFLASYSIILSITFDFKTFPLTVFEFYTIDGGRDLEKNHTFFLPFFSIFSIMLSMIIMILDQNFLLQKTLLLRL